MGALNTKQWAEVLTTGSPGSPEAAGSRTGASDSVSSAENSPSTSTGHYDADTEEKIEGSGDLPRPKHRNLKKLDLQAATDNVDQLEKSAKSESDDDDDDDVGSDGEEATDTSGQELLSQELLSTPTAIDKQLHKFKVHGIS